MSDRPTIVVEGAAGGWPPPWSNVAEIEAVLPCEYWTLIGGLMVQLHAIHKQIDAIRPTSDIDLIVHVETGDGRPAAVADALGALGYHLKPPIDPRANFAHRFVRGSDTVDMVTSWPGDVVDVVVADHAAPRALTPLRGYEMVQVEGGTQALRRTVNAMLDIAPGTITSVSVPDVYGGLILKAAAHKADSRDPDRHLADAAVLLACMDDPFADHEASGSDRSRLLHLQRHLGDRLHPAWFRLPEAARIDAQRALDILCE